ncbi:MAG: hypothetical protein N4A50_12315 [Vallitalea sp.]|jgi:hypothetical protein|nr:hypothetical protein [Vallitalea sp.]
MTHNNLINDTIALVTDSIDVQGYFDNIRKSIVEITKEQILNNVLASSNEYKHNESDNVQLLKAIQPMANEQLSKDIDKLSEVFEDINVLKMFIDNLLKDNKDKNEDISDDDENKIIEKRGNLIIEDNTVYEVDEKCKANINSNSSEKKANTDILALLFYMILN